jgi:alpha-glucoside transport system substrate-binding protein
MMKRSLALAAIAVASLAAACGSDDDAATEQTGDTAAAVGDSVQPAATSTAEGTASDDSGGGSAGQTDLAGTTVTVSGAESSDVEAGSMQDALDVFAEENGMTINYVGGRDFEEQIGSQVAGGNPPDIGIFAQPGKVRDFAAEEAIFPLPDDVDAATSTNWGADWLEFWQNDDVQYGVPVKSGLKSLVWYSPAAFAEKGYEVPPTLDDFFALTEEMIANGDTPLCVGIESGPATGWPFTDWVEDMILRNEGIDYYNQWVAHEVPFNDPPVVEAMAQVADLWSQDGAVYASGGSIAATPFGEGGQGLVDGSCMMHRQGDFFASFFPEGTQFGDAAGAFDTFYFPSNEGTPVLVSGNAAVAFRDAPEIWAVMKYYGSPEFADNRQAAQLARLGAEPGGNVLSGYMSANINANPDNYSPLEQGFLEVLATGEPAGFDGSDQMPGEVGAGSFWQEATALVNGAKDAQAAADAIEASWPS